jgi:hypothetical protein
MKEPIDQSTMDEMFFQSKPCLTAHVHMIRNHRADYLKTLRFICESGTVAIVPTGVRARILAALYITNRHKMVTSFLQHCEIVDIAKALYILDRSRKVRQLTHRIEAIEKAHPHLVVTPDEEEHVSKGPEQRHRKHIKNILEKQESVPPTKRRRKIDKYRRDKRALESEDACHGTCDCIAAHEDSANHELILSASVSGALARKIRHWAKTTQRSDFLEFALLTMPLDCWKQVADMVHFAPSDFCVPYFLQEVHRDSKSVDEGLNFVSTMRQFLPMAEMNNLEVGKQLRGIVLQFPQVFLQYSLIRRHIHLIRNKDIMEQFAAYAPFDTVIWYFEEFHQASKSCQDIVLERIQQNDDGDCDLVKGKVTYGKLVERILTLRRMRVKFVEKLIPMANSSLELLRSHWTCNTNKRKIAVFGDASASMRNAIEAATIFASMVSVCFDAKLSFFATDLVPSPHEKPCNVEQALEVCTKVRADNSTCLASALWPYLDDKIWMDMFVMVTDEEENTGKKGWYFAEMLAEYKKVVNPAVSLVIVRIGYGIAQFHRSLQKYNINYKVVQMDENRPDHAKFDALLGQLALMTNREMDDVTTTSPDETSITTKSEEEFVLV